MNDIQSNQSEALNLADLKGKIDFGIITIRADENLAVLGQFEELGWARGKSRTTWRICSLALPQGRSYLIAVGRCSEQGNTYAQSIAQYMKAELSPAFYLVVGIAGALNSKDLTLGDVVISNRFVDFTVGAIAQNNRRQHAIQGGDLEEVAEGLVGDLPARMRGLAIWDGQTGQSRPSVDSSAVRYYGPKAGREQAVTRFLKNATRTVPIAEPGAIAVTNDLTKSTTSAQSFLDSARNCIAVEMESGGVYRAVKGSPFLAIRGISDIVGFEREEAWTPYACWTAATFLRMFLMTEPRPPLASRSEQMEQFEGHQDRVPGVRQEDEGKDTCVPKTTRKSALKAFSLLLLLLPFGSPVLSSSSPKMLFVHKGPNGEIEVRGAAVHSQIVNGWRIPQGQVRSLVTPADGPKVTVCSIYSPTAWFGMHAYTEATLVQNSKVLASTPSCVVGVGMGDDPRNDSFTMDLSGLLPGDYQLQINHMAVPRIGLCHKLMSLAPG